MNAAYRQEKKNGKRPARAGTPLLTPGEPPPVKKLKEAFLLPFPVDPVLDSEHSGTPDKKSGLEYPPGHP